MFPIVVVWVFLCCSLITFSSDPCSGSESKADSPKSVQCRSNGDQKPI